MNMVSGGGDRMGLVGRKMMVVIDDDDDGYYYYYYYYYDDDDDDDEIEVEIYPTTNISS